MTTQQLLHRIALAAALVLTSTIPASAQFGAASGVRPAIDLAGGIGTAGFGGRLGLGVSADRFSSQVYFAGTLDGLVLVEGDSASSAWVNALMLKAELGSSAGPVTGTVGLGFGLGSRNKLVPITDPDELAERRARGQSDFVNVSISDLYVPVDMAATYWLGKSVGVSAGGYVGVPLTIGSVTRRATSEEVSAWQWAALVGLRFGRPAY